MTERETKAALVPTLQATLDAGTVPRASHAHDR